MKTKIASIVLFLTISITALAQDESGNAFEVSKNLDIYNALFQEVNKYYVDPIQPGKMVKKSLDAMLKDLDPYTNYITEEDIEDYRFQTTGKYGGIGCSIKEIGSDLVFSEIHQNGPADKAGLKPGMMLLEIDGKSVKGYKEEDVRKLVKGSPGTSVSFKVKNPITNETFSKKITREEISVNILRNSNLLGTQKEFAYVQLTQFTEACSRQVKNALDSLKGINPSIKGVILDLRGNPGGLLDEAVNLSNLFVPKGILVVSTKGKVEEWNKDYKTSNLPWDENIPIVVLINKASASASEIVSGVMQDLDRGVIIGEKSFGKGLVQSTRNLPFNAKVKITTAKYYTPTGRCIQALDYSNRNADGSVGAVPDSLKTEFRTKAGRKVFDGGGVEPDITISSAVNAPIFEVLMGKHLIFQYANEYVSKNPTIAPAEEFTLTDQEYNDFLNWLDKQNYQYNSKSLEALQKVKEIAEKELIFENIKASYEALNKQMQENKTKELSQYKKEIKRLLQAEIAQRYYYDKGKALNLLQDDEVLKEAIKVLSDPSKYRQILGK